YSVIIVDITYIKRRHNYDYMYPRNISKMFMRDDHHAISRCTYELHIKKDDEVSCRRH
ncbi:hypothetical protein SK128_008162, partial [Halocaridina rubra]